MIDHIRNLLKGLGIAGKHLGRHAITIQYPEERMEMPERSRGIVVLLSDKETGELNCTACELCMRACPTAAIKIVTHRDENKKKHLDVFEVDNGLCCFCGLCEEACNFSALKMATKYEFSTLGADELVWDVNKLQEVGRDVDYVDTRKKKKPKPEPKADAKPTAPKPEKTDAKPKPEQPATVSEPVNPAGSSTEEKVNEEPLPEEQERKEEKKEGGPTDGSV